MAQDMSFLDSLFTTIKESNEKQIEEKKEELNLVEKRRRLEEIRNFVSQYYKKYYYKRNLTRWSKILGNVTYEIRYDQIKANKQLEKQFIQYLVEAYQLILDIIPIFDQVHSIRTVVTAIDSIIGNDNKKSYSYFRFPDMQYDVDFVFLSKQSSKKGQQYGLKFKEGWGKVLKGMAEINEGQEALNTHFQAFIEPFVTYQAFAVNTTHWKINKGVLGETFERHLQNKPHNNIKDLEDNSLEHLGSVGERWILYKQSSGSDPFFSGPDTELAQIKNVNASIVSNIQTLISTINGLLVLINEKGEITRPKKELDKIFNQADFKMSLSQDVYMDLENQAPQVVKSILQQLLKNNKTKIVLTRQVNGKTRKKTYKIDTQHLTLKAFKK